MVASRTRLFSGSVEMIKDEVPAPQHHGHVQDRREGMQYCSHHAVSRPCRIDAPASSIFDRGNTRRVYMWQHVRPLKGLLNRFTEQWLCFDF